MSSLAPDLCSAEFDPGQISQVIANLVVNANQAMPNGGTMRRHLRQFLLFEASDTANNLDLAPGDYIRIRASRRRGWNSRNVPEANLRSLFYNQGQRQRPRIWRLFIQSSKNHNGLIIVDSEVHYGSTFTVFLPASRRPIIAAAPGANRAFG